MFKTALSFFALLCFFISPPLTAQDTLSFHFPFGDSKKWSEQTGLDSPITRDLRVTRINSNYFESRANRLTKDIEHRDEGIQHHFPQDSLQETDTSILMQDQLVLEHMEYFYWIRNNRVLIRLPITLLNDEYVWYSGCDTSRTLHWKKGDFPWNKEYAYTSITLSGTRMGIPTRKVTASKKDEPRTDCGEGPILKWKGILPNLSFMGELGYFSGNRNEYFTLGIEQIRTRSNLGFQVGKYSAGYGGELQARYHLLNVPITYNKFWKDPDERWRPYKRFLRGYIGTSALILTELSTSIDLHTGLSLCNNVSNGIFNRVYLQYNYQVFSSGLTGITGNQLRLGVSMRLLRLKEYK